MTSLFIRCAEIPGVPGVDIRIEGERIAEIGKGLIPTTSDVLHAGGGAVLPGLHDHHVHLRALVAARASVRVGPPTVTDRAGFASALQAAASLSDGGAWVRAIGYHQSVAGDLDASALDAVVTDRPVRVQHRTGVLWILNSAGLREVHLDECDDGGVERDAAGRPTGRLWRMDAWLRDRVPAIDADLPALGREALARGVTGFTDADPDRTPDDVSALAALPQRLHLMGPATMKFETDGHLSLGPVKVMLDDDELPPVDELAQKISVAHLDSRPIAVHCVTRAQLVLTVAALREAGPAPHDRIEHGAVVPDELLADLRRLGATVVTQPNFVAERGDDYMRDVDADDVPLLYRCRSLIDADVPVAAGTDAPFGDADPWAAVKAAIERTTASGAVLGPDERLPPARALALFLGEATEPATLRVVAPGASADLCILRCPLAEALHNPSAELVRATVLNGAIAYEASS